MESEVRQTPFGQITFNVQLVNGVVQLETISVVKSRRRKYDLTKKQESDNV